jgi:Macro domain
MEWVSISGRKIALHEGDITRLPVDAMVNAANSALAGGGGVDGAIHHAGGPGIMHELNQIRKEIGYCPTGSARGYHDELPFHQYRRVWLSAERRRRHCDSQG